MDDLGRRRDSDAIIRAATGIAGSLGIETLAEGVETPEQLAKLVAESCTELQGFLLSRPVPANALHEVIAGIDRASAPLGGDAARGAG